MLKGQIVINQYGHIVCTAISTRTMHDFKLFKKSRLPIKKETKVSVDTGYLGITSLHPNTDIPKKKSKLHPLTIEHKIIITPPINNLNYVIILDGKNRRKKIITKRVV